MKRKELTKFLAMMMCVAMVTGSGVPVAAADFDAEEIAVETQVEDEDYAEGDTEEVVADEEADEDTEVAGNAEDAADLFSDEETEVAEAGEEEATGLSIKATLNGGNAVDAEITNDTEKVRNKECTVVNVTFKSSDLKEGENKVSLTPTLGNGGDSFTVGSTMTPRGVSGTYTEDVSNSAWTTTLTTVEGTVAYAYMTRTTTDGINQEWYVIKYHISNEEETTNFALKASLNGGTSVDAKVTDTLEGNLFKVVNVTFSGSDLKETGNTIALTPTVGAGDTVEVGVFRQGRVFPTYSGNNGVFTLMNPVNKDNVDGTYCDCIVTHSNNTSDYYRIYYSVYVKKEMALSGQITNGDYVSASKDATVTEKTGTYNKFAWTKEVNLTFESTDAKESGINTLKFKPVIGEGESLVIGTSANYKDGNISQQLTADADGNYSISLGTGNGPAKVTKSCYCTRTYADGTTENYKINIVRKGYASLKINFGNSEENPSDGVWSYYEWDEKTGDQWMGTTLSNYTGWVGVTATDAEGNNASSKAKAVINPDYKGNIFELDENNIVHAHRAGASSEYITIQCGDLSVPVYLKALYKKDRGETLLKARQTDGTTTINTTNFANPDAFAALFPDNKKEDAKKYYNLVTDLQEVLSNNKNSGEGSWDYEVSKTGQNKFWSETCESAKVNKILDMSSDIWANIYGIKDAKDTLTAAADLENVTDEAKKAELETALNEAIAKIDADYKDGKITSIADVNKLVEAGKKDIYTINPISIEDFDFTLSEKVFTYDGKAKTPEVTVKNGETVLKAGEDYDVEYKNNTKGGTATVTVTGKGIYTGVKELTFTIESPEQKPATPGTTVKDPNKTNTTNSTNTAKTEYKVLNIAKASFTKTEGNKAFKLGVKTKVKGTVAYKSSNKKVVTVDKKGKVKVKGPGRAVITVTGKAKGFKNETAKITITVKPSAKLSAKATAQSGKKLKVTWKRNKKASGYQIVVATDKSFKNVVKTVNVKKNKTVKATVKGLKSGKKYYVRVRSMKKSSGVKVYGNWSKAKPVKAKK